VKSIVSSLFLVTLTPLIISAQTVTAGEVKIVGTQSANTKKLPPYLVYRHFLAWVNELDKDAKVSGTGNSYKFAEPFGRANLEHQQLDSLRDAAHQLDAELQKHQARAQLIITHYRSEASRELAEGKPLPPAPPEIRQLERERTALLIQNYVAVRAALGPKASAQLDKYLDYEFAPHVKLRRIAEPASAQTQSGN
jgi:hypothetical protein